MKLIRNIGNNKTAWRAPFSEGSLIIKEKLIILAKLKNVKKKEYMWLNKCLEFEYCLKIAALYKTGLQQKPALQGRISSSQVTLGLTPD